ncbi:hypothetical protein N9W21_04645 [Shewanella sp.]|nr:hypothetical protein [Shewanella sp.]
MNFHTSYLVGLFSVVLAAFVTPVTQAETLTPLSITGPEGQVKPVKRQYGPTTSSDTFWSIAQKVKPDPSVTVYQVMSALYDANPHAFSGKNYNSLERGMILLIPSKDVIAQISKANAKARAENNDRGWNNQAQRPVTPAAIRPSAPKTNALTAKVQLLTEKLELAQAHHLSLTDELARAADANVVQATDIKALQAEVARLQAENALLKQSLQDSAAENSALNNELAAKQKIIEGLTQPKPAPESTLWRSLMDNVWLLLLGAVLPAILALGLVWWVIRRRTDAVNDMTEEAEELGGEAEITPEHNVTADNSDHDFNPADVVQLDPEQVEPVQLSVEQPATAETEGTDFIVEEAVDEGLSLDELWAEAMEEQDDLLPTTTEEQPPVAVDGNELGSDLAETLTTGTPTDAVTNNDPKQDELDRLLAEFDSAEPSITEQTDNDIDALADEIAAELELPLEIAAELDENIEQSSHANLDNELDILLAELEAPVDLHRPITTDPLDEAVNAPAPQSNDEHASLDDIFPELESPAPIEESSLRSDDTAAAPEREQNHSHNQSVLDEQPSADLSTHTVEWDTTPTETFNGGELLNALSASDPQRESDEQQIVDAALAALNNSKIEALEQHSGEDELADFQQDNNFIDIDMLLNEAEEEVLDTDLYKELDVDMGELDALMDTHSMVDVDDAENTINAKLDLARAYIEIDDNDSAIALLREVETDGNGRQQAEAGQLIKALV